MTLANSRSPHVSTITFPLTLAAQQFETYLHGRLRSQRTISPETIATYTQGVRQALAFWQAIGLADDVAVPRREHVEHFYVHLREERRVSQNTIVNRDKALRAFFRWLRDEGEISEDPMQRTPRPELDDKDPRRASIEQLEALLATCAGRGFHDRRDAALIRFMFDTGWRVSSVLAVTIAQVEARGARIEVPAKGRKSVFARIQPPTQATLDRYLRVRGSEARALWATRSGRAMDRHDVYDVFSSRSHRAFGLDRSQHVHPHMLRHAHAHYWLAGGGNLADLMENLGHSSIKVTERYLRALGRERAMDARDRYSPGNLL